MESQRIRVLIGMGIFAAVVIPLYWILWFFAPEIVQSFPPSSPVYPVYVTFEQAFLLADAWLMAAAIIGTVGVWRRKEWGFLFMLLGGSSAIYLGLMDLLFDLQHSVFLSMSGAGMIELVIVLLTLGFGTLTILLTWSLRRLFILAEI